MLYEVMSDRVVDLVMPHKQVSEWIRDSLKGCTCSGIKAANQSSTCLTGKISTTILLVDW